MHEHGSPDPVCDELLATIELDKPSTPVVIYDYRLLFGPTTKLSRTVDTRIRLPDLISYQKMIDEERTVEYGIGFIEARSAVVFNPNIKSSPREHRRNVRLLSWELLQHGLPAKKSGGVARVENRRRKIAKSS